MALKNTINLGNISQVELGYLKEITSMHQNMATKYSFYSNQCQDAQLKQIFQQSGQDAEITASSIINSLK